MSDNVSHIGREIEEEALGRSWRFARWDRSVWVAFADWARTVLPDPIECLARSIDKVALADERVMREVVRKDQDERARYERELSPCKSDAERARVALPVALAPMFVQQADALAQKALDKASAYLSFNSPELNSLVLSVVGSGHLAWLLLRKHQPNVTEDEAFDVAFDLDRHNDRRDERGRPCSRLARVLAVVQGRLAPAPKNDASPSPAAS